MVDRFIQQAVLQVLQAKWDASFSESSYGFRPRRSAHQAVEQAQRYLQSGYTPEFVSHFLVLSTKLDGLA